MVKGLSKPPVHKLQKDYPEMKGTLTGGFARSKGYHDFNAMMDAGVLNKCRKAYCRFTDEQLETAIKMLLSSHNISLLSWGLRTVKLAPDESTCSPWCRVGGPSRKRTLPSRSPLLRTSRWARRRSMSCLPP